MTTGNGKWIQNAHFTFMVVLVTTLPFLFSARIIFIANRFAILFLVFSFLAQFDFRQGFKDQRRNVLLLGFLLYFLLELLALLYSQNMKAALRELEKSLPILAIPVALLLSPPIGERKVRYVLSSFVYANTLGAAICLAHAIHRNNYGEIFSAPNWFYFTYYDLTEILGIQPIYFSVYTSFSFFIITFEIVAGWSRYRWLNKTIAITHAIFLFVFLILLSGKAAILVTLLITLVSVFVFFQRMKKMLLGTAMVGLVAFFAAVLIYKVPVVRERFLEMLGIEATSTWVYGDPQRVSPGTEARLIKWKAAWIVIKDNWILGVAPGDVQDELDAQYARQNFQLGIDERFNAHNQFLQTWMGLGLVGVLTFIAGYLSGIRKSWVEGNYLYLVFLSLFGFCCITESMLERQFGIIFYCFFTCLFYMHPAVVSPQKATELSS